MSWWNKPGSLTCIRREDETEPGSSLSDANRSGPSLHGQPQFENSPLPAAMLAVAHSDSPKTRRVLYDCMLKTWFVVPTGKPAADMPGFHDMTNETGRSLSLERDSAGQIVAVAFTDKEALRNWNKTIAWIALQGAAFFQAVLSTTAEEIVINPYEPKNPESKMIRPGGRVTRWEFTALARGDNPWIQVDDDRQSVPPQSMLVTMPSKMPSEATFAALADAVKNLTEVSAMYFAQLIYPDGEPHLTVAVEFVSGSAVHNLDQAMAALAGEMRKNLVDGRSIDFLSASTPVGQSITKLGKEFFRAAK